MMSATDNTSPLPSLESSPCLQGERVSFTGTLASMTHRQAMELVEQHGGEATAHASKQTTMLIVGEEGWPLEEDGQPSLKLQHVTEWRQQGAAIRVLRESEWLHLLGLEERRRDVHRLQTPAMLSQALHVSVGLIRRWERIGLITAVKKVFRLPYFDFQEVARVRRLSELLSAGVSRHELEASLTKLQSMLPGSERTSSQLELLARNHHLVVRDAAGILEPTTRQRLLDFGGEAAIPPVPSPTETNVTKTSAERSSTSFASIHDVASEGLSALDREARRQLHWSSRDWFEQGCRWLEEDRLTDATEAFRLALMEEPSNPELHFHLAEALYREGNLAGAFERLHIAVELDQQYLEAWTQLGCVAAELGQTQSALDAFGIALQSHADYPDAHFHKAELLHRMNRDAEATPHWQAYLNHDQRGPWADIARQRSAFRPEAHDDVEPGG